MFLLPNILPVDKTNLHRQMWIFFFIIYFIEKKKPKTKRRHLKKPMVLAH